MSASWHSVVLAALVAVPQLLRASKCTNGPCWPGNEVCGPMPENGPIFHLQDQRGCGENDPNAPVFDPVHGIAHHFYQDHLSAGSGGGPIYGHFVSKDFVHWAQMPVAIWNGLDSSVWPPRVTPYDTNAIYTGSAVIVDGAGPDGEGAGIVHIYPGLCRKEDWANCTTGTLLAQAVPADYAGDALLTNWTKPSYNPIMEGTQRDPTTPWRTSTGEWRLRNYNALYGTASDADMLAGKWYPLGSDPQEWPTVECPSFYPLPKPAPGFEDAYAAAMASGGLPTHIEKTSGAGRRDYWRAGTYVAGAEHTRGTFSATPGWEDLYADRKFDQGNYYASKDNVYPSRHGAPRRINWGWVTLRNGMQSLPREITFNAAARTLEQAPIEELKALREKPTVNWQGQSLKANELMKMSLPVFHYEVVARFELPSSEGTFGVLLGSGIGEWTSCIVKYVPPTNVSASFYKVPVECGNYKDTLHLTPAETIVEVRIFVDSWNMESYYQNGRVAITQLALDVAQTGGAAWLVSDIDVNVASVAVYPMSSIYVSEQQVRSTSQMYFPLPHPHKRGQQKQQKRQEGAAGTEEEVILA